MADPSLYTYPSPLTGYENLSPLPNELNPDGKSLVNPPTGIQSPSYEKFIEPLDNGVRGAFPGTSRLQILGRTNWTSSCCNV
ncbi:conserved hypothetical protein [Sclerotinia sclerotiorum 1980 UF-70]|uniref:Uncharacterized protein n=1 Tax=Sclerotinia sclerotiorum (strain ATCC 18683 / 1980 / Ss-1) TaxID=665079 RepID=A7ENK7_SCLS1|nr:conserved hypothetical protein [Sclerotinia sclerotiorum 1980 UF-70]EDO04423.1 conserved hypothetical protein [Sclerotinia sclerotiorum 1980 UF-70]